MSLKLEIIVGEISERTVFRTFSFIEVLKANNKRGNYSSFYQGYLKMHEMSYDEESQEWTFHGWNSDTMSLLEEAMNFS